MGPIELAPTVGYKRLLYQNKIDKRKQIDYRLYCGVFISYQVLMSKPVNRFFGIQISFVVDSIC